MTRAGRANPRRRAKDGAFGGLRELWEKKMLKDKLNVEVGEMGNRYINREKSKRAQVSLERMCPQCHAEEQGDVARSTCGKRGSRRCLLPHTGFRSLFPLAVCPSLPMVPVFSHYLGLGTARLPQALTGHLNRLVCTGELCGLHQSLLSSLAIGVRDSNKIRRLRRDAQRWRGGR